MMVFSKTWFEILSELFVNLAAGWFAVILIEPYVGVKNVWLLFFKLFLGIVTLMLAKVFREEGRQI